MYGVNRVFLMGYLGADPEVVISKSGKPFVRMSLSTHHGKRLANGEMQTTTTWHRVTVWGKTADRCKTFLRTGSALAVEGSISRYAYTKSDGSDAMATSIVARQVHFVDRSSHRNR